MTEQIQIPRTIGSAQKALGLIEGLLLARNWEKAAIVYAFTYEGTPGRPPAGQEIGRVSDRFTVTAFVKLGIVGLRDKETVIHYRRAWKTAVEQGEATDVRPGQKVILPDLPFPPFQPNIQDPERRQALIEQAEADGLRGTGKVLDVASNPKAVASAMKADPEFARKVMSDPDVAKKVMSDPGVARAVVDDDRSRHALLEANQDWLRDQADRRLTQRGMTRSTPSRHVDPQDRAEERPSKLRVEETLLDFVAAANAAQQAATDALLAYEKGIAYFDDESRTICAEHAEAAADAWQMVLARVRGGGATDEALEALPRGGETN